jgi:hypothetical protein
MASTYSSLKIQLMGTGENSGTWGTVTNLNLGTAIEEAIVGSADVTFSSGTVTLTLTDTNSSQTARNLRLNLTGTSGGAQNLVVPAIEKVYIVNNGCADTITVKNTTGTGIAVPAGKTMYVYNNGTNVVDAVTHLTSLTLASALPVTSGGTGVTTSTGTGNTVLSASPALTGTPTAPTAAVTTDNTQIATTAFVRDIIPTGLISLWSGAIAAIPSGWLLCDGTNGTPDLRSRFVVGAGSTYGVDATGGSADATLVSHTHTFSGNTGAMNANQAHTHGVSDPGHNHQGGGGGGTPGGFGGWFSSADTTIGLVTSTASTGISINATNIDHLHAYSGTTSTSGSSATNANLPPYYALAYIMKS